MVYDCKLSGADVGYMCRLMWQGIPFDLSAWAYFNALFVVMRFIPAPFVASRGWLLATDVVYIITNSLLLCINIADVAMFPFSRIAYALCGNKELLYRFKSRRYISVILG